MQLEKAAEEEEAKAAKRKTKEKSVTIKAGKEYDTDTPQPRTPSTKSHSATTSTKAITTTCGSTTSHDGSFLPPDSTTPHDKQKLTRKDSEVSNISSISEYSLSTEGSETDTPISIKASSSTPMAHKRHSDSFLDQRRKEISSSTPKSDEDTLSSPDL